MQVNASNRVVGSLRVSTQVLAKIAKLAALEVDGVAHVQKPASVVMEDGLATVNVHVAMRYGAKIQQVTRRVQSNIKSTIQNMTGIVVVRVNVVVAGIALQDPISNYEE